MAEAGIADVLIANQLVQPGQGAAAAEVARSTRSRSPSTTPRNADQLSRAAARPARARAADRSSTSAWAAAACARRRRRSRSPSGSPGCRASTARREGLRGPLHARARPRHARAGRHGGNRPLDVFDLLAERRHRLQSSPAAAPAPTTSPARTPASPRCRPAPTLHGRVPRRARPGGFEVAMTVPATVISRQGNTVVLDCGRKSVGIDFVMPAAGRPEAVRSAPTPRSTACSTSRARRSPSATWPR